MLVGWPRRPVRAAGSRSDKMPRHARSKACGRLGPSDACMSNVNMNLVSEIESAWRGFLSLRDPAGAKHAAGPPDPFPCDPQIEVWAPNCAPGWRSLGSCIVQPLESADAI